MKRINPTVERISKAAKDDLGKRAFADSGAKRPKTEGPRRIPPIISPTTRAWPTFRASQPHVWVVSITTAISIKRSVKVHRAGGVLSLELSVSSALPIVDRKSTPLNSSHLG